MDGARALPNTSDTTPDSAGASPCSAETWKEEEGRSVLEYVTAPEDSTELSALLGAGDSAEVASPLKKVRLLLGAGVQLGLVAVLCELRRPGCIPHILLATSGSRCLQEELAVFADAVLCVLCRGKPQIAQVSLDTAALLCAAAERVLNIKPAQFSKIICTSLAGLVPPLPGRSLLFSVSPV